MGTDQVRPGKVIPTNDLGQIHMDAQQAKELRDEIDPWKHRSAGMKCRTCMWFVPKEAATLTVIGRCRRHAPTMNGYPVVFPNDWCGDHKLNENSL